MTFVARVAAVFLSILICLLLSSLTLGSRSVPLAEVWRAFTAYDPQNDLHLIVRELRLPRSILALSAGAALGLAGGLMQAVTRNSLAEPGLLGVNAGAAFAVVLGSIVFRLTSVSDYVWCAMFGAAAAGAAVLVLGRANGSGTDPLRLVLAGAGLSMALGAATSLIILNSGLEILDIFRYWGAGALDGRGYEASLVAALALLAGSCLAAILAASLDALALGQDFGRLLGLDSRLVWGLACIALIILSGGATAAAGPIPFIGLIAPHIARAIVGIGNRRALPLAALLGASLLLSADILGRLVAAPDEVAAGIIAALIGGGFFIYVARNFRLTQT